MEHYIEHQKNIVTRRTHYDLERAKIRAHILEGLIIAIQSIDKVISIIRSSKNPKEARLNLKKEFKLTEMQAQAILDMRLQKLTGLEIKNLENEHAQVLKQINKLNAILSSEARLLKVIKNELLEIKRNFSDKRRTNIVNDISLAEIRTEDLIHVEDVIIVLSRNQDIKRVPIKSYQRSLQDDQEDLSGMDYIEFMEKSATDHRLLFFTDTGYCYSITCKDLPEAKWRDKGVQLSKIINGFDRSNRIVGMISIPDFQTKKELYVQIYTENGMIKRTHLKDYDSRVTKIKACRLKENDLVIGVEISDGKSDIMYVTKKGMSICFNGRQVNPMGRTTIGVRAIQLKSNDKVVFAKEVDDEGELTVITDRGFAKRTLLADYERQGRGGIGFKTITFARNGSNGRSLAGAFYSKDPYSIKLIQKDGTITELDIDSLPIEERSGKGQSVAMVVMDNEIVNVYRDYN